MIGDESIEGRGHEAGPFRVGATSLVQTGEFRNHRKLIGFRVWRVLLLFRGKEISTVYAGYSKPGIDGAGERRLENS